MTRPSSASGDGAKASVFVSVGPAEAFAVFTDEIDLWWRTGPRFRIAGKQRGRLAFEPGVGGRLFETFGARTFEVGRIAAWEPGARLAFEWRGVNFEPDQVTFVEVEFRGVGDGTMVSVSHRGWLGLPPDHPARHGHAPAAFDRMIGMWWGDLLTALREHVSAGPATPG
jgi:hypothetical protein